MAPAAPQTAPPPGAVISQLVSSYTRSRVVQVAAKLGIADLLRDGPRTADDLAAVIGADAPSLQRFLRTLAMLEIVTEDTPGRFATTPLGEVLRKDHPQSMHSYAVMMGEPFVWRAWEALDEAVLTGAPGFDHLFGEPFFTYLAQRPAESAIFNAAMTGMSDRQGAAILAAYDFSGYSRIVDVGGGEGALLRGILARYPRATGVLFDLPTAIGDAQRLRDSPEGSRCELVGGDMFAAIPGGGDAYLLKSILHDWSDAEAIRILQQCRRAIAPEGKLLICEAILKAAGEPDPLRWQDLMMLVVMTGRERTAEEFRELYAAAGFRLTRIVPAGWLNILEGVPI